MIHYPLNVSASENQWIIGTLLVLLMGLSLAMVPVCCTRSLKSTMKSWRSGKFFSGEHLKPLLHMLLVISMSPVDPLARSMERLEQQMLPIFKHWVYALSPQDDWIQTIGGIVFSVGALMILRSVLSNQAHSSLAVRLGFYWRSVVLHCQHCKHV